MTKDLVACGGGSKGEKPNMIRPDGKRIDLEVRDYVPYLCSKSHQSSVSLAAKKSDNEKPSQRLKVLASSSNDVEPPISEDEAFSPPDMMNTRMTNLTL